MNQKDKELLLKDLCARLPYKTRCSYYDICLSAHCNGEIDGIENKEYVIVDGKCIAIGFIKPYLFPIPSMTKEQEEEYGKCYDIDLANSAKNLCDKLDGKDVIDGYPMYNHIDWLNKNHFDYRGLIPMGLANDATGLNIY